MHSSSTLHYREPRKHRNRNLLMNTAVASTPAPTQIKPASRFDIPTNENPLTPANAHPDNNPHSQEDLSDRKKLKPIDPTLLPRQRELLAASEWEGTSPYHSHHRAASNFKDGSRNRR